MINWQKLLDYKKFLFLFAKKLQLHLRDTTILRVSAALSYTTLLAVVPLIAIALAVFAAFPMFEHVRLQVQDFLIQNFVPNLGENVQQYMAEFVAAAGKLTTIGVAGLAVTAVLMLSTIESSFNFIFKIKKHRRLATKMALYWTLIILCPIVLGIGFSLRGYMLKLQYFNNNAENLDLFTTVVAHNLLIFAVLGFSYYIVPNKKIRLSSAFIGAAVAFIMMTVLRYGFGYFLQLNVTYKTLYGAMASVPLLLVWMYSWWTVVLFGAVIVASLEELQHKKQLWK
ncbi:MAG: YihY family inner membrane protein [Alphaproteobacteria bacterium]|nr:YihY family inner membrane protein [Alphaproteobacteria bacterium]